MQHSKIDGYKKIGKKEKVFSEAKKKFAQTGLTIADLRAKIKSEALDTQQKKQPDLLKMNEELLKENINLLQELEIAENKIILLQQELDKKNKALKVIEDTVKVFS